MNDESGGPHPSPEELEALVGRQGPEAGRLRHLDHVMACDACRAEFELLRAVVAAEPAARRVPVWLPLAATVVLAVGLGGVWWTRQTGAAPEVTRDHPAAELPLVFPADSVGRSGEPLRFGWRSAPSAVDYQFELLTDEGRVVHAATVAETTLVVPGAAVFPGRYRWWVTARRPGGNLASAARLLILR